MSDASTLPDITEQVQRLEKMRRMDTDAEQQDVSALTSSTQVESGMLMHNMI